MTPASLIIVSVAAFLCVASLIALIGFAVRKQRDPLRRRLMAATSTTPVSSDAKETDEGWPTSLVGSTLRRFGIASWNAPGVRTIGARAALFFTMVMVGIGCGTAVARGFALLHLSAPMVMLIWVVSGWLAAMLTARYWMRWHQQRRLDEINNNIIDVIDLWVLCLGAGMSFASALVRIAQDEELTTPELREELQLTNQEMLAGCPREEALRHFVRRCGDSTDLRALVSHIIQSERMGSSLTDTLRIYAQTLRFKRTQDTKEQIQTLPLKLTFPLIFCILPALFVIILGPSVIRIFEVLTGK